jgi:outer membrane protein
VHARFRVWAGLRRHYNKGSMNPMMHLRKQTLSLALTLIVALSLALPAVAQKEGAAQGGYKIGVVDIEKVIETYPKKVKLMEALQAEVSAEQSKIDVLTGQLNKLQEDFAKTRATMSDEARNAKQAEIGTLVTKIKADTAAQQIKIDEKEANIRNEVFGDVEKAIQTIAESDGYHLILNARAMPNSSVLYASPTIDISSKVSSQLGAGGK